MSESVIDEMRLLYDFAMRAGGAKSSTDVDAVWREMVEPVAKTISDQTLGQISRLYSLKMSTVKEHHDKAA